ncbi:MAG: DUF4340 domain-containing protein [Planctomycetes bacterium]|nr:DUF4340 domain-containing protein [Planctomycetota bacterium]
MNRTSLILSVLAALQLVVIVIFLSTDSSTERAGPADSTQPYAALKADDIASIDITEGDGAAVRLERATTADGKPGKFGLADKGAFPVREIELDNVISAVQRISVGRVATRQEKSFTSLEVAAQRFNRHVVLKRTDGTVLADFYLGSGKQSASVFFRQSTGDAAHHATGVDTYEFGTSASALVETQFTDVPGSDVTKLILEREGSTLMLDRSEREKPRAVDAPPLAQGVLPEMETVWTEASATPPRLADNGKVEALLAALGRMYLAEPIGRERKAEFGFEKPVAKATLVQKDGKTTVISVGAKREKENDHYVERTGFDWVATIRTYTLEEYFLKKAEDLQPDKPEAEVKPGAPDAGHEDHDHK